MFSDKARNTLRIVVGLYLLYLGGSLVVDVYKAKPENMVLLIMIGIAFAIIGGIVAGFAVKGYIAASKAEREELESEEDEADADNSDEEDENEEAVKPEAEKPEAEKKKETIKDIKPEKVEIISDEEAPL